ncbi:MAG: hypothetical protein GY913_29275 [Proteobacteria bacterium]|nr:hypothetical protein [Pseudomonadota bacterium]MCP4921007.1 hypothetical protein [Pseudomonadota bacterium]
MLIWTLATLASCGEEPLSEDAYHWDVKVTGVETDCVPEDQQSPYGENLTYSLEFTGSLTKLMIGTDSFATGTLRGCELEYESQVVGDQDRDVQWVLSGHAVQRTGGDICDMADKVEEERLAAGIDDDAWTANQSQYLGGGEPATVDWVGMETFEIVASEDASIPVGCTYTLFVAGNYRTDG